MKKTLLCISQTAPYNSVPHAGGKIHYYYLKKLMNDYDITLITGLIDKKYRADFYKGKLDILTYCYFLPEKGIHSINELYNKIKWKFQRKFLAKQKYFNLQNVMQIDYVNHILKKLFKENYSPDQILLDWTDSLLYVDKIRKYFPNTKITLTEQDVTFQNLYRRWINSNNKKIKKLYLREKEWELKSINKIDCVNVLNEKDKKLLLDNGIIESKIKVIVPYYDQYFDYTYKYVNNNIIFYGAMYRPENREAVHWFIENVFYKLPDTFTFTIIGGNPTDDIKNLNSKRIKVTGFVNELKNYFENALCMVVPLINGAGIKIKVLEGMSASLPVLTNEIGIEGIPAKDGDNFLFCNTPDKYINEILKLSRDEKYARNISNNARNFVRDEFNFENCSYL